MNLKAFYLISFVNFFIFKDLTDFTSGYTCIRKSTISNYSLKGYYGEYFLELNFLLQAE